MILPPPRIMVGMSFLLFLCSMQRLASADHTAKSSILDLSTKYISNMPCGLEQTLDGQQCSEPHTARRTTFIFLKHGWVKLRPDDHPFKLKHVT